MPEDKNQNQHTFKYYENDLPPEEKSHTARNFVIIVVAILIIGSLFEAFRLIYGNPNNFRPATQSQSANSSQNQNGAQQSDVSADYTNALNKADMYANVYYLSKQRIYDQLTSEPDRFRSEAAQYAVDNVNADYNANALVKAQEYSEDEHLSRQRLITQLTSKYEGFTEDETQYAIDNLNADYNANALAKAKEYQSQFDWSPDQIHDRLTSDFEGFTSDEADYAIAHLND